MKIPKPPRYQAIGFWCSIPFITLALCYIMYGQRLFGDWTIWVAAYPVIYLLGYVSWRTHYVYDYHIRMKFPSLGETRKRVLWTTPVNILVMTPSVLLIFLVFHWFGIGGYSIQPGDLCYGYLVGLGVNIVFESLWEVMYIIEKYKETAAEREMIERLQLQQEFNNLKQKVNPHFLFNCFNTLSSLISEDKLKAEQFLDELSKVYRYLLRNNESGMSTVEQESRFIESYAELLQTRYGAGFQMQMAIDPSFGSREIPALSLQMLVENAVKHNTISKSEQIQVRIRSLPEGYLVVENNLNKKKTRFDGESTGIGLSNIREKYRLLNRHDVVVEESGDQFRVQIPLLS